LAAGDLPDVFRWADRSFIQQAYEAGYLMDITEVFAEYASADVLSYQTRFPDCFEGASFDGRLYGFPYMNDNFHQAPFLWIRDDWLENLGETAPKTMDEFIALAKRFTTDDPDGNGANDTFGLALDKNILTNNFGGANGILAGFGVPSYNNGVEFFYRDEDGEMTTSIIQDGMKQTLSLLHDLYVEGVIDPEFIVKDTATMEPDVTNGKYGMMFHSNWGTWHPFNYTFTADGTITRPYAVPVAEGVEYKVGEQSNKSVDVFMVNANCKNPEAIIKILNLYEEVCVQVPDEEDYYYYWDNEQYRLSPIYVGIPTELHTQELAEAFEAGSKDNLAGSVKPLYDQIIGFQDGTNITTSGYGAWGQMYRESADRQGSCVIALEKYRPDGAYVDSLMSTERPEIYIQNSSVWESMMETAFTDIIRGDRPIDYFEQWVQDYLSAGGRQCLDELDKLYPAE
ncbi:MAG: extracellular solute-binding protein, partial [Oscillospiraceae bacterium]|nr:extracellular solute-binding protein [Oscillospiraceae bacterium]